MDRGTGPALRWSDRHERPCRGLSVNPADPAEFVVAYATGGLWHTTDHGTSFTPLFDHETVIFLGAIAVDWDTRTLWAGTGEANSSAPATPASASTATPTGAPTGEHGPGQQPPHRAHGPYR